MALQSLGLVSAGVAYSGSEEIPLTMVSSKQYSITTSTAAWLLIAAAGGTAVKQGAGCHYIPAFVPMPVAAIGANNRCILVMDTAAGWAQLSEMATPPG